MKTKIIAIVFVVVGFISSGYLGWAFHRTTGKVLVHEGRAWLRPWPYPDEWIAKWNHSLDLAHPAAWGTMKMRGELPRIQMYLSELIALSLVIMIAGIVWLNILKRQKAKAQQN